VKISDWEGGHALPEQAASDVRTFGIYRVRDYFERGGVGHLVLHWAGQRWQGEVRNPAAVTGSTPIPRTVGEVKLKGLRWRISRRPNTGSYITREPLVMRGPNPGMATTRPARNCFVRI